MMNLKLSTVVFGTQVVDGRDGKVWTVARKDSKAKTLILTDADGKERPFALNTVNRNFDEVLVEEVVVEEPAEAEEVVEAEVAEVEEPKAEKKAVVKQDRFALVMEALPVVRGNLAYRRLKGDRVGIVSDKRRLVAVGKGRHGYTLVTNKFDKLVGLDIKFRKTSDGRDAVFTDIPAADMEKVVRHVVMAG